MEMKRTHFKMYKDGRKWVFACAVVLAIGGGTTVTASAAAESSNSSSATSSLVSGKSVSSSGDVGNESTSSANSSSDSQSNSKITSSVDSNSNKAPQNVGNGGQVTKDSKATAVTSVNKDTVTSNESSGNQLSKKTLQKKVKAPTNKKTKKLSHVNSRAALLRESLAHKSVQNTKAKIASALANAQRKLPKVTTAVQPLAEATVQDGGSVYDDFPDLDNLLGVSSVFHIFAREAELNAHTNGNLAVQNLTGNVNFGTNIVEELLDKDISYIQNFTKLANSSFVSSGATRDNKVIFGEGLNVDISNPNRPTVNGVYIDHLVANEVYQDKNGQTYIDFDAEFAKLKATNEALANKKSEASYSNSDFTDQNNRVIDVSDMTPNANNQIVINLTPEVLQSNTPLYIKGLSPDADGTTVIFNVDTGGQDDYTINSQIKLTYSDGVDRDNQETEHFGDNHLLWNFYDSTASNKQYGGTITVDAPFQGSLLAPSATIVANKNVDGNIIADKVIVNAETHRWDLQGNSDKEDPEEPEEPEVPEEPEPEVPGPETPEPEVPGTEEPGEEVPGEDGDEDLTYEHVRPDYDEEAEDFWDDLIADEAESPAAAHANEEALLARVDAAIAQAKAEGNTTLVAQLEAIRDRILADLGELPQTGEAQNNWAPAVGTALLTGLLGTLGALIVKRRRE